MKTRNLIVILILVTLFSCNKKEHPKSDDTSSPSPVVKTLDTSFLKLGKLGEIKGQSNIKANENVIVLTNDQDISFTDIGVIEISNFDSSLLDENNIIVGNINDQLLLKVESVTGDSIKVRQGNISQLAAEENTHIKFSATPEINFEDIAQPTMEIVTDLPKTEDDSEKKNGIIIGKLSDNSKDRAKGYNVINFKNYELITGDDTQEIQLVGSKLNLATGTDIELEKNGDFKIEIEEGHIQFIPTFKGDFQLGFFKVKNLESSIDALIKYRFKIKVTTDGKLNGKVSFPLFKDLSFPIKVQAGYVPVYAEVNISFPAGLSFDIKGDGAFSFVVESEYAFSSQMTYTPENGNNFKNYSDYIVRDRKFEENQSKNNYQFELFVEPKISTNLYKVLGPFANIHTGLMADVSFPLPKGEEDLFFNFNGEVGIQVLDPIWEDTLYEAKSPTLFNINRGWDIIGPKEKRERNDGHLNDVNLQVHALGQDNCVSINLKSKSADRLTSVSIYKSPEFGTLLKDEKFNLNGRVKYCPPKNIEGQDSFQIRYTTKGKVSNPARMVLSLGEEAKKQAAEINFSRSQTRNTSRGPVVLSIPANTYTSPQLIGDNKGEIIPVDETPEEEEEKLDDVVTVYSYPKLNMKEHSVFLTKIFTKQDIGNTYGQCKMDDIQFNYKELPRRIRKDIKKDIQSVMNVYYFSSFESHYKFANISMNNNFLKIEVSAKYINYFIPEDKYRPLILEDIPFFTLSFNCLNNSIKTFNNDHNISLAQLFELFSNDGRALISTDRNEAWEIFQTKFERIGN